MWQKHSVFHVSLLEPAPKKIPVMTQVSDNYLIKQEGWYEVKQILQHKDISNKWHYLVKWKGYSELKNTWEPERNLDGCKHIMRNYCWQADSSFRKEFRQPVISPQKTREQQEFWSRWQPQRVPHPSSASQCFSPLNY